MALTNNNLELIKAIAKNDLHTARVAALASLTEDTSKKNAWAVGYYRKMLVGNASVLMSNLPSDMQTFLVGETPDGFDSDRYFLRDRDAFILHEITKMRKIADELASRRILYKNTTLLYGESGTGKTEFARFIANKLRLPFFYISFNSTIDSHLGSTAKNIKKIFEFCSSIPCVLMLDEIDAVAVKRASGGSHGCDGELERTTISIMQELDRLPNHVTLIAATNRLDIVDLALLRRFSIRHEMTRMSESEMIQMARQFVTATHSEEFLSDEETKALARSYEKPGDLMPELVRALGERIYEKNKDKFEAIDVEDDGNVSEVGVWRVRYEWEKNIAAQSEEDAIAIGRRERMGYGEKPELERYSATPAQFLSPEPTKSS